MHQEYDLQACHCCGLIQQVPALQARQRARCARCHTPFDSKSADNRAAIAFAWAALIFYLPALGLPLMQLERLGHHHSDSLISGLISLLAQGYWFIGGIVLLFSVVLPLFKLLVLLLLSAPPAQLSIRHRALLYRAIELFGRWGMLDVMLVAILIAFVKLGNLVNIHAGTGLIAFASMVLLNLVASLLFNPHHLWQSRTHV